jgi:PAS domain S-box-containing protein
MPSNPETPSPITTTATVLFETVFDSLFDAVMITNTNFESAGPKVVYVNKAFERITGWSSAEIKAQGPYALQGPKTDPAVIDRLKADLAAGRPFSGSTVNYRRDGSPFPMEWSISFFSLSDTDNYYITIQRDTTEFRRAPETHRQREPGGQPADRRGDFLRSATSSGRRGWEQPIDRLACLPANWADPALPIGASPTTTTRTNWSCPVFVDTLACPVVHQTGATPANGKASPGPTSGGLWFLQRSSRPSAWCSVAGRSFGDTTHGERSGTEASLAQDASVRRRLHRQDVLEELYRDERALGCHEVPVEGSCQIEHLRDAGNSDVRAEADNIVAITVRSSGEHFHGQESLGGCHQHPDAFFFHEDSGIIILYLRKKALHGVIQPAFVEVNRLVCHSFGNIVNNGFGSKNSVNVSGDPRSIKRESHRSTTDNVEICPMPSFVKPAAQFDQCLSDSLSREEPAH